MASRDSLLEGVRRERERESGVNPAFYVLDKLLIASFCARFTQKAIRDIDWGYQPSRLSLCLICIEAKIV